MLLHSIPDELIINADQTHSKFVVTDNITIAAKEQKHISRAGSIDKITITLTVCESLDGKILPFQLICKEKTQRSLPTVNFPMFVYRTMKTIGVMRRRPPVLLSRLFCHILRTLKKKKIYQTIKKVSLYETLLKLILRPIYLMFYRSTKLSLLWYQRT